MSGMRQGKNMPEKNN